MGKGLTITAFVFSLIIPVVGLILGIIAYKKAKDDPEALKGLAIAAIVIGSVYVLITSVLIIIGLSWLQVRGTVQQGSKQIELMQACSATELKIMTAYAKEANRIAASVCTAMGALTALEK